MSLAFAARKALEEGDLGVATEDSNVFMKDLGVLRSPTSQVVSVEKENLTPKNRTERERVPGQMAAELMDYFVSTLNDTNMMNPIRDGIPQCRNHPFDPPRKVGCIHSCAKKLPDLTLPVVREYSLGDVFEWVKALVGEAVRDGETQRGWRGPADLTR